ncbi:MDR family MFS transporter [Alicyclobacillus sp. SO9]|uniref:MDR family MFS transporter n=1 Tax=Alicyclobacillus sp. SO9 TaxID=2665646 RepID=UPI0018E73987|nr:MDR family MFS transporter [Alicyclobacillus sp. SO9]QQE80372.1 MFS transporter [Alicyclobacillus sp. SO9]
MHQRTNRRNVTIALMVATFLAAMDNTVVSTAMPTIVSSLGGLKLFSWVFSAYMLTMAVTTPIYGKLADLFGRKIIFTIGTILFLLGSMLSGLAQSMDQLIWFRAFQGIGAGAVLPVTLTIIGDIYSYERRAKIQGLFSAVWGIAGIAGPLIGGFFVDYISWRFIFYINVPVGLVSMVLVWIFLKEDFEPHEAQVDYAGAAVFTAAVTSLLYALISGGTLYPWNSDIIFILFAISLVGLIAFVIIEQKSSQPMIPPFLFQNRTILVSNVTGLLSGGILMGISAYLPMWIQGIEGHSATSAGLTLAPMSLGWFVGATVGGRLMLKIGSKPVSILGMFFIVLGGFGLTLVAIGTQQWILISFMVVIGLGYGFSMTAYTVIVQTAVDWEMRGAATASIQFLRTLGQTVGVAVLGAWFNHVVSRNIERLGLYQKYGQHMNDLLNPSLAAKLPEAVLEALRQLLALALHNVYLLMACFAVVGFLISLALPYQEAPQEAREEVTRENSRRTKGKSQ